MNADVVYIMVSAKHLAYESKCLHKFVFSFFYVVYIAS